MPGNRARWRMDSTCRQGAQHVAIRCSERLEEADHVRVGILSTTGCSDPSDPSRQPMAEANDDSRIAILVVAAA